MTAGAEQGRDVLRDQYLYLHLDLLREQNYLYLYCIRIKVV